MIKAQLTDILKAYEMLMTSKSAGLSFWEGLMLFLFILKDLLIVGGILGVIVWYIKYRNENGRS
jgi:hypothetical protein